MFKLVVLDLDGTVLTSHPSLTEEVIFNINRLKEQGIGVTIATGRMFAAAEAIVRQLAIQLPIISLNGAWVQEVDQVTPIFTQLIDPVICQDILGMVDKYDVSLGLIEGDKAYVKNLKPPVDQAFNSWIHKILPYGDIWNYKPCEILLAGDQELIWAIYDEVIQSDIVKDIRDRVALFKFPSIRYDPMWYLEFRDINCSKGSALKLLREYLNIDKREILVVGDYYNDIPMFEEAGYSAAMGNAPQEVKAAADFVTDLTNDQGGVIHILNHLIMDKIK